MSSQPTNGGSTTNQYPQAVLQKLLQLDVTSSPEQVEPAAVAAPSRERRSLSLREKPFDTTRILEDVATEPQAAVSTKDTVLYLAYGSNLSAETFKGKRGIKPLSQVNVLVPELELTFDLPGLPYKEPCFANTRYRKPKNLDGSSESDDYHKDRWQKGLVGVVYEVTKADFAIIIATEGGGSSYQDIVAECYEIPPGSTTVDDHPSGPPFKAHTLFSPALPPSPPGTPPPRGRSRLQRPDPSYAQASARYLKLILDGAKEHNLPNEYIDFLRGLRPFTMTSYRQRLGSILFLTIWSPVIIFLFSLGKLVANKKGRVPNWYASVMTSVFSGIWFTYDHCFKGIFGDGERTQTRSKDEEQSRHERQPLL